MCVSVCVCVWFLMCGGCYDPLECLNRCFKCVKALKGRRWAAELWRTEDTNVSSNVNIVSAFLPLVAFFSAHVRRHKADAGSEQEDMSLHSKTQERVSGAQWGGSGLVRWRARALALGWKQSDTQVGSFELKISPDFLFQLLSVNRELWLYWCDCRLLSSWCFFDEIWYFEGFIFSWDENLVVFCQIWWL